MARSPTARVPCHPSADTTERREASYAANERPPAERGGDDADRPVQPDRHALLDELSHGEADAPVEGTAAEILVAREPHQPVSHRPEPIGRQVRAVDGRHVEDDRRRNDARAHPLDGQGLVTW